MSVLNKLSERVSGTLNAGKKKKKKIGKTKLFSQQSVQEEINQTASATIIRAHPDNNDPADENEWQYYGK